MQGNQAAGKGGLTLNNRMEHQIRKWIRLVEGIDPISNKAFVQWFGDSKAVDKSGRPLTGSNGQLQAIGHVMPLYVRAENPFITDRDSMSKDYVQEIRDEGYDAIFRVAYLHRDLIPEEIVVFHPNQVKSAIANNGNFSPDDNRIQESVNAWKSFPAITSASQ